MDGAGSVYREWVWFAGESGGGGGDFGLGGFDVAGGGAGVVGCFGVAGVGEGDAVAVDPFDPGQRCLAA